MAAWIKEPLTSDGHVVDATKVLIEGLQAKLAGTIFEGDIAGAELSVSEFLDSFLEILRFVAEDHAVAGQAFHQFTVMESDRADDEGQTAEIDVVATGTGTYSANVMPTFAGTFSTQGMSSVLTVTNKGVQVYRHTLNRVGGTAIAFHVDVGETYTFTIVTVIHGHGDRSETLTWGLSDGNVHVPAALASDLLPIIQSTVSDAVGPVRALATEDHSAIALLRGLADGNADVISRLGFVGVDEPTPVPFVLGGENEPAANVSVERVTVEAGANFLWLPVSTINEGGFHYYLGQTRITPDSVDHSVSYTVDGVAQTWGRQKVTFASAGVVHIDRPHTRQVLRIIRENMDPDLDRVYRDKTVIAGPLKTFSEGLTQVTEELGAYISHRAGMNADLTGEFFWDRPDERLGDETGSAFPNVQNESQVGALTGVADNGSDIFRWQLNQFSHEYDATGPTTNYRMRGPGAVGTAIAFGGGVPTSPRWTAAFQLLLYNTSATSLLSIKDDDGTNRDLLQVTPNGVIHRPRITPAESDRQELRTKNDASTDGQTNFRITGLGGRAYAEFFITETGQRTIHFRLYGNGRLISDTTYVINIEDLETDVHERGANNVSLQEESHHTTASVWYDAETPFGSRHRLFIEIDQVNFTGDPQSQPYHFNVSSQYHKTETVPGHPSAYEYVGFDGSGVTPSLGNQHAHSVALTVLPASDGTIVMRMLARNNNDHTLQYATTRTNVPWNLFDWSSIRIGGAGTVTNKYTVFQDSAAATPPVETVLEEFLDVQDRRNIFGLVPALLQVNDELRLANVFEAPKQLIRAPDNTEFQVGIYNDGTLYTIPFGGSAESPSWRGDEVPDGTDISGVSRVVYAGQAGEVSSVTLGELGDNGYSRPDISVDPGAVATTRAYEWYGLNTTSITPSGGIRKLGFYVGNEILNLGSFTASTDVRFGTSLTATVSGSFNFKLNMLTHETLDLALSEANEGLVLVRERGDSIEGFVAASGNFRGGNAVFVERVIDVEIGDVFYWVHGAGAEGDYIGPVNEAEWTVEEILSGTAFISGGGGGGGSGITLADVRGEIANWAEDGNNDPIPAPKLVNAPSGAGGLNQAQVDERVQAGIDDAGILDQDAVDDRVKAGVADWAEAGNDGNIPLSKFNSVLEQADVLFVPHEILSAQGNSNSITPGGSSFYLYNPNGPFISGVTQMIVGHGSRGAKFRNVMDVGSFIELRDGITPDADSFIIFKVTSATRHVTEDSTVVDVDIVRNVWNAEGGNIPSGSRAVNVIVFPNDVGNIFEAVTGSRRVETVIQDWDSDGVTTEIIIPRYAQGHKDIRIVSDATGGDNEIVQTDLSGSLIRLYLGDQPGTAQWRAAGQVDFRVRQAGDPAELRITAVANSDNTADTTTTARRIYYLSVIEWR